MSTLLDLIPLPGTTSIVVLGALALGITAGVVGSFAVLQSRSLVGDAMAHAALPGIAVAFIISGTRDPATLTVGAAVAAAIAAILILALERTPRLRSDAAIGVVLAGAFSTGIVLLTWITGSGRGDQGGLETYLFGQAAGIVQADVITAFVLMACGILTVVILHRVLRAVIFDRSFSAGAGLPARLVDGTCVLLLVLAVVIGLRMVGAILMVVMLIAPGVTARQFVRRLAPMLVLAGALGGAIAVSGALTSAALGLPTGPVIALIGTGTAVGAVLLAPGRGVVWNARSRMAARARLRDAEILIALDRDTQAGATTAASLADDVGRTRRWVDTGLRSLRRRGLVDPQLSLTDAGRRQATSARDAVLAWTAWLEHGWRLGLPDARDANPLDVAGSLGAEMAQQLTRMAREDEARAAVR